MSAINTTQFNDATNNEEPAGDKWICQILVAEGVFGALGNLFTCFIILRVRFLRNMTNYLLVNLAAADVLVCVALFVYYLTASSTCALATYIPGSFFEGQLFCRLIVSGFLNYTFSYASAYSLCLVTLERYVAIVHPLHYTMKLTPRRMVGLVALVWLISFLFPLPLLLTREPSDDPNNACSLIRHPLAFYIFIIVSTAVFPYLLPVVSMCWAYHKIQATLKRQAQALKLQHASAAAYDLVIARQRVVSMLTIVLGALLILWTPTYILNIFFVFCRYLPVICSSNIYQIIRQVSDFLFYFNSAINPIIYEFKYKKFRQGFKVAFCSCPARPGENRVDIEMVAH